MPPKKRTKKVITIETTEEPEKKTIAEKAADFVASIGACNHQNKHYTAGDLFCVLPPNHGGDHLGYVNDKPTAWSDAAGKPVRPHA
jgi:hypothetical protein